MTKKGQLFKLIKSLSKSEKRYFKLFSGGSTNKNYLRLFDAIDEMDSYDEQALREKLSHAPFTRQLHVAKIYLNDLVLKSLKAYHSKISQDAVLKELLRDVEILFIRELYDQCHYVLKKAKRIAGEQENFPVLIQVYNWERKLIQVKAGVTKGVGQLEEIVQKERKVIGQMGRLNDYWDLTFQCIPSRIKFGFRSPLLDHHLLTNASEADSIHAKLLRHHVCFALQTFGKEGDRPAIRHLDKAVALLEDNPHRIREDPSVYITALNNKLGVWLYHKKYEELLSLIHKIRTVPEVYKIREDAPSMVKVKLRTYNVEMELYRDTHNISKGLALIEEITGYLSKQARFIPPDYELSFYFQFAYIHFLADNYSKSLKFLNRIIGSRYDAVREDIQWYSRLLNLIIHFELDNIMVLKYAVDASRRYLKNRRRLKGFEQHLLQFFSHINMADPSDYPMLFDRLHAQLFTPGIEQMTNTDLDYIDVRSWIEKRLKKVT